METLKRVGDKIAKFGEKILFVTIVKELGLTDAPIKKMGITEFKENVYNPYFDDLMKKSLKERKKFIDEKLSKLPEIRRNAAQKFLQEGMRDYYQRKLKRKNP